MKKILLIITLLISLISFSQSSQLKLGLHVGLNYSNFRGYDIEPNPLYNENPAFAYLAGLSLEHQIKEKLSIRLELNYERKSQKADNVIELRENWNDPSQVYEFTFKKNYDYLVLPILLKYKLTADRSFYINGGPFIGLLLKSKLTNDLNTSAFDSEDLDTTKDNKKTDFGISLGFGKNFAFGNKSITVELRENLGLSNTSKIDVFNGGKVRTNSINLIVGFIFN